VQPMKLTISHHIIIALVSMSIIMFVFYQTRTLKMQDALKIISSKLDTLENLIGLIKINENEAEPIPSNVIKELGGTKKHPVIIIPGFASSHLEIWNSHDQDLCFKKVWGSLDGLRHMLMDKASFLSHLKLKSNGKDPENIKVRACKGLESCSHMLPGYWVWSKIIRSLSLLNYDSNSLVVFPYDWRISFEQLEQRDAFFTRLKNEVEMLRRIHNEKVVILSHSMGAVIAHHMMHWVEEKEKGWCDQHLQGLVNIAAPQLGVPRSFTAIISGDWGVQNTSRFNFLKIFFSQSERAILLRNWESVMNLLPKGTNKIWKHFIGRTLKKDDQKDQAQEQPKQESKDRKDDVPLVKFTDSKAGIYVEQVIHFVKVLLGRDITRIKYFDPTQTRLPDAPNLTIYSLYGIDSETEGGYCYKTAGKTLNNRGIPYFIDRDAYDEDMRCKNGVFVVNGDGTVPLISLGYMGRKGWKNKSINPSNVQTIVREYRHRPVNILKDLRGGPSSAGHVDILGNTNLIIDVLRIVSGTGKVKDRVHSELDEIIKDIEEDEKVKC
ncbi:Lecithin:cholesterol acyltransferase (LCAT)/Acyl-ceramide synthase, partial [Trachipleistophora hominis]